MCGIGGAFRFHEPLGPRAADVARLSDLMIARGPDGQGTFRSSCGRAELVHRRLAIIDVAGSPQPMSLGPYTIVFNGEIYNYRELRQDLVARGVAFRTHGDTETLLQLYALHGDRAFSMLRGMYAIAIWDDDQGALTLCRDPLGIKPLYIARDEGTLWFASQARSLQAILQRPIDDAARERFYLWGHVPEPQTWWKGITSFPAGVVVRVGRDGTERHSTFSDLTTLLSVSRECSPEDATTAIRQSVRAHLTSDVPMCIFLSAGVDSTAIAEIATQQDTALTGVTVGFKEFYRTAEDEIPEARETARLLGIRHEAVYLDRSDFERNLPKFLADMDVPTTDGLNTWMVSQVAHSLGFKVALSGIGGDELFGGYPSFRWLPCIEAWQWLFQAPLPTEALAPVVRRFGLHPKYPYLWTACRSLPRAFHALRGVFMPQERPPCSSALLDEDISAMEAAIRPLPTAWQRVQWMEIVRYLRDRLLRDADWAGMSHSVEIRTPLVDTPLYQSLLGSQHGKSELFRVTGPVTRRIRHNSKKGFEIPMQFWRQPNPRRRSGGHREWLQYLDSRLAPSSHSS